MTLRSPSPLRRKRVGLVFASAWAIPLALGLLAAGCASDDLQADSALDYSENAKREYERGMRALESGNWEAVDELMNEVRRKYAYSRYARLAELRMSDANYRQEKYAEAISGYKSFVHDYPNDPEVPYARYWVARSQYDSVSQSALLPPLEERDLASVNDALDTIQSYLGDYPTTRYKNELGYMLAVVVGLLARHELYVARFYLAEDNFKAAVNRVEYALKNFARSGLEPEALVLLGEIYMKQKEQAKARSALRRVLAEYPDSAFTLPAKNLLALLGPEAQSPAPAASP